MLKHVKQSPWQSTGKQLRGKETNKTPGLENNVEPFKMKRTAEDPDNQAEPQSPNFFNLRKRNIHHTHKKGEENRSERKNPILTIYNCIMHITTANTRCSICIQSGFDLCWQLLWM